MGLSPAVEVAEEEEEEQELDAGGEGRPLHYFQNIKKIF
jgi:hypothetical protein